VMKSKSEVQRKIAQDEADDMEQEYNAVFNSGRNGWVS